MAVDLLRMQLANGLRRLMGESQDLCRLRRIAPTVTLGEYIDEEGNGRLSLEGLHTCKSSWCAMCVAKWERTRADEIGHAVEFHNREQDRTLFFTGTMRHHKGQALELQIRLLRKTHGEMWSGRIGQLFSEKMGGKPESVRAIDLTWSDENGWHPHIHSLLFMQGVRYTDEEYHELFDERWRSSMLASLKSFHRMVDKVLAGKPCRKVKHVETVNGRERTTYVVECACCLAGKECPRLRERATRVFGAKLIRRRFGLVAECHRIRELLKEFTPENIEPSKMHGVRVEKVDQRKHSLNTYLTKLGAIGFELASSLTKLGKVDGKGIMHYGPWELARLATIHGHKLRTKARRAWSQLFKATFATQRITFSDRAALDLGEDPYADQGEPDEQRAGEMHRVIAHVEDAAWDAASKLHGHGLLVTIHTAYALGVLPELAITHAPTDWHAMPSTHDPTSTGPPRLEWWQRLEAETRAKARGARFWGLASAELQARDAPPPDELWLEEIREKLERSNASRNVVGAKKEHGQRSPVRSNTDGVTQFRGADRAPTTSPVGPDLAWVERWKTT